MITINPDRSAYLPDADRHIGFEGDHLVEQRLFRITDTRLFGFTFKLDLGETADIVALTVAEQTETSLTLRWDVTSSMIGSGGIITAQLRAFDPDGDAVWHSAVMEFVAAPSLHAVNDANTENNITEFEQIEQSVAAALADLAALQQDVADKHAAVVQASSDAADDLAAVQAIAARLDTTEQTVSGLISRAETAVAAMESHTARTDNPHTVTALQAGAYTKTETDSAIADAIAAAVGDIDDALDDLLAQANAYVSPAPVRAMSSLDPSDRRLERLEDFSFEEDAEKFIDDGEVYR